MLKFVQLKIAKIKYRGDSIGGDIRVEVEALGKFLRVDKRIRVGATAEIDREVGVFETDQKSFKFNAQIVIIEKDLLFNDTGNSSLEIKVDTTTTKPQQFFCKIEISESRFGKKWGKKKAVFEIILEAIASDAFLYVSLEQTKNGWVQAVNESDKTSIDLPAYLKVKLEKQNARRQYFTILEGPNRGVRAYIKIQEDGTSFFESENYHTGSVHLIYSLSKKTLKFGNEIYKLKEYKNDPQPWKKTFYDIRIPDYYHRGGRYYLNRAKLAPVWFKTTHPGDNRYIHPGSYSLGCVTLVEIERWDELCKILLRARRGDFMSVGILEVID